MEYFKRLAHGAEKQASIISIRSKAARESSKIKQKLTTLQTEEERLMISIGKKVCELHASGIELNDSLVYLCQSAEKYKVQTDDLREQLTDIQKRVEKEIEHAHDIERQQNAKFPRVKSTFSPTRTQTQPTAEATLIDADKVPPTQQAEIENDDFGEDIEEFNSTENMGEVSEEYATSDMDSENSAYEPWLDSIAYDEAVKNPADLNDTEFSDAASTDDTITEEASENPAETDDNVYLFSDYTIVGDKPDED